MKISRRRFIKAGAVFTTFAGTSLLTPVFADAQKKSADFGKLPAEALADPFLYLTSEDFKKYVGAEFSLITETGATAVVLTNLTQQVKPSKSANKKTFSSKPTAEIFSLSFQSGKADFSQTTYRLFHPNLGEFDLFLVPGEAQNGKILLHAVINRI